MKHLDDLFSKANSFASVAGKKTGDFVEVSKLKLQVTQLNSKINDSFKKLGSSYYKMKNSDHFNDEHIASICSEIDLLYDKLNVLESNITNLKNAKTCSDCGSKNTIKAEFCSNCGAHIDKADVGNDAENISDDTSDSNTDSSPQNEDL